MFVIINSSVTSDNIMTEQENKNRMPVIDF